MANPTEEQIHKRAQEIWEENLRPTGRDVEFWFQAEIELNEVLAHEPTFCPDNPLLGSVGSRACALTNGHDRGNCTSAGVGRTMRAA